MAPVLAPGATVTDVGSVKQAVVEAVAPHIPPGVQFIPGHPLAGTEHSGPRSGFATLFEGRWCILTPVEGVRTAGTERLAAFWERLGARVEVLDAQHHDRVLAVTSPNPREGKSTMASNLAIALAEVHRRVILIDGDLHKPSLHAVFNLANTWGLSDILTETIPVDQYPADSLARPTEVPGVYVLTSGPAVIAASSILYSERMSRLLERLRGEFDYVLIDTPPMMVLPDARILGQLSEGVILVFRAGTTSSEDVRTVGKRLAEDGTTILGTVLNDWKPRASGRGSYYYRHYNNYYVHKM